MASISSDHKSSSKFRVEDFFSREARQQMSNDDTAAGTAVSVIIIAIVTFGLVSMAITLAFAL